MNSIIENMEAGIQAGLEKAGLEKAINDDVAINIILDSSDPQNPVFVEIENDQGESISIGELGFTDCGLSKIRISTYAMVSNEKI